MAAKVPPERLVPAVPLGGVPNVLQRLLEIIPVQLVRKPTWLIPRSAAPLVVVCLSASLRGIVAAAAGGPVVVAVVVPIIVPSTSSFCALPGRIVVAANIGPILVAVLVPVLVSTTTNFGASGAPRIHSRPWVSPPRVPMIGGPRSAPLSGALSPVILLLRPPKSAPIGGRIIRRT